MSKQVKRLGRGLDSLVSDFSKGVPVPVTDGPGMGEIDGDVASPASQVSVKLIDPNPFQPRDIGDDADVASLADSIRMHGMLQPIMLRQVGKRYQIVAGERRFRAACEVGLEAVPAIVREADDQQMLELALIENIQREDLNPIERANAYSQFCERFDLTADEVGRRVGEDRTTVSNYIRLLELPDAVQRQVAAGRLMMGHARCLLGVIDEARRERLAQATITNVLSVRALEDIVRREKKQRPAAVVKDSAAAMGRRSAHLKEIEQRMEQAVKTKVYVQEGKRKGSGRIVIHYYTLDDFDRIATLLGVDFE